MNNDVIQHIFDLLEMRAISILAFKSEISKKFNIPKNEIHNIILYLKDEGYLLLPNGHTNIAMLTSKGFDMKNNGWINHLNRDRTTLNTIGTEKQVNATPIKKDLMSIPNAIYIFSGLIVSILTIANYIPENTPFIGISWWKNYLKI